MQKSNLHEYAIYTFVIFCLAFIFPFVLFFFIVVLNKVSDGLNIWPIDAQSINILIIDYCADIQALQTCDQ